MIISVIGAGPGHFNYYTNQAIETIKEADLVLSSVKVSPDVEALAKEFKLIGILEMVEFLKEREDGNLKVAILASGDVGFYSIATTLRNRLPETMKMDLIPGISSMLLMSARCSMGYEDMKLISLHGREKSIIPFVSYNRKVFSLTGGKYGVKEILQDLIDNGLTDVEVHVGENLTLENERIHHGKPEELIGKEYDSLSVMIIVNDNYVNHDILPREDDYVRGKRPMTKEAIRNLSVEAMEIEKTDVVWDVGAGTGGVTIALSRRAYESTVYAIEKEEEGIRLINENKKKLGAYNVVAVEGNAPEALEGLPKPDKVFLGGTTGQMDEIVSFVLEKNPNALIVANAITLETIGETVDCFNKFGLDTETMCANISKAKKLGRYNMMMAENPIYIIKGVAHEECETA